MHLIKQGTIYSVFANANASEEETECSMYMKHTMTSYSAFDFSNYKELMLDLFEPIIYKTHRIGMTICYDCNHALFSRMYGVQGVDIIINSTGGDVVYDKWYKYNRARAIENKCYTFVTMGGENIKHNFVYGFTPNGKEMYSDKLKGFKAKRYILVCKYKYLDKDLYNNKLSAILKVRAMENFCAVILESAIVNNCYQTGKSRTAQVLEATNGMYGLDLSRMPGPEAIWKNKSGSYKAIWRENFTWLANECKAYKL